MKAKPTSIQKVPELAAHLLALPESVVFETKRVSGIKTSKMLRKWVSQGMLTPDMSKGKRHARYFKSGQQPKQDTILKLPGFHDGEEDSMR